MNAIIQKNSTHLIEVECWGYDGDRELFEKDIAETEVLRDLRLGDEKTNALKIGDRTLLFTARKYSNIPDDAALGMEKAVWDEFDNNISEMRGE